MENERIINGYKIRYSIDNNGQCVPNTGDLLKAVGLELMWPKIQLFYELISDTETVEFLRWVSYVCDIRYDTARERLKHYFIIEGGLRMEYAQTAEIRSDELVMARSHISATEEEYFFSNEEIIEMLNDEGFNFKLLTHKN